MLVHRRVTPSIKFAGIYLFTWVERGTVRVKCFAQEHNTMSPARARTRTAHSRVECTNHEATAPPIILRGNKTYCFPHDQLLSVLLYLRAPILKTKNCEEIFCLTLACSRICTGFKEHDLITCESRASQMWINKLLLLLTTTTSPKFKLLFPKGVSEFWPKTRDTLTSNRKTYLSWEV